GPFTLILSGNVLYGTANGGGRWGNGTVFALSTDGSNFATLHKFTDDNGTLMNGDGKAPLVLISSGSALYGTTMFGGSLGFGTVFRLSADGSGFRTLHTFAFTDSYAQSALLVSGNTLYGTIA